MAIKVGILGCGNLGGGVECTVRHNPGIELRTVFTKRDPAGLQIFTEGAKVLSAEDAPSMGDETDALILCGGSATDLPMQTSQMAEYFDVTDSFDTRANIPQHFDAMDRAVRAGGYIGIISVGQDPGMFSPNRLYANAVLPGGRDYTFWDRGVGRGHPDAVRRIHGVEDAKQYTIPMEETLTTVESGSYPELTTRQKHTGECFVVTEEGADLKTIETAIVTMPNYFANYDTTVHFISEGELLRDRARVPHGGFVIRTDRTSWEDENSHVIKYSLKLDSNPEFTTSVIAAYARAAYWLSKEGQTGCRTVFNITPSYLSAQEGEELRKHLL